MCVCDFFCALIWIYTVTCIFSLVFLIKYFLYVLASLEQVIFVYLVHFEDQYEQNFHRMFVRPKSIEYFFTEFFSMIDLHHRYYDIR